jgi:hypothetical protein
MKVVEKEKATATLAAYTAEVGNGPVIVTPVRVTTEERTMLSLSECIVQCVTVAGDGRYTPAQIADLLGESEEWVEQILAAWEYNPKVYLQFSFSSSHLYDTRPVKAVEPLGYVPNMTYDPGPWPIERNSEPESEPTL